MRPALTPERFWAKVKKTDSCWIWTGTLCRGYGQTRWGSLGRQTFRAHRIAWLLTHGSFPTEVLDHLCRNRACVNPAHLEVVSIGENVRRGSNANRDKTHCKHGHPLVGRNVHYTTQKKRSSPLRECYVCKYLSNGNIPSWNIKTGEDK